MARASSFLDLRLLTRAAALLGCAALLPFLAAPAKAQGTVTIQQPNGSVDTYGDVKIKVIHNSLYLTSKDGGGTLEVSRAACSYQGEILTCFPLVATLIQPGATGPLDLKTGTIYTNMSGQTQQLPLSTMRIPSRGIVMSFSTKRGTYVNVVGVIDEVHK